MSQWTVSRDQWAAWIEQGTGAAAPAAQPLDTIDAQLAQQLAQRPFLIGDEETVSRPGLSDGVERFDSMTTMVRSAIDLPADEEDATRVRRPEHLEVGLAAPEDGLEVSLQPTDDATVVAEAPLSGQTIVAKGPPVAEAPAPPTIDPTIVPQPGVTPPQPVVPQPGATPPQPVVPPLAADAAPAEPAFESAPTITQTSAEPAVSGHTVIAQAPLQAPPPEGDEDDGMFIPTLTKTVVETAPLPVEEPPIPEPPPSGVTGGELPPAISGETVIGPPPSPPGDDGVLASGSITTSEPDESAQTLIRGEIPYEEHDEDAPPTRPRKVVIDPSASGVLDAVYDEEEPDDAPLVEEEPQELDADDLVEESDELVATPDEASPPPAPARPPPAPEAERPVVSAGPPPPPVAANAVEAAMAALPVAPPMDEGWQIDAFGEQYAALLPTQRPAIVAAEADFIIHCAGLVAGASVLDVGSGDGAHALAFAARGLAVTALEPSPVQLMRATQNAQAMGLSVNLVSGDMRQPPLEGQFDAVVCLGGTLGMFGDEDDRLALQHMRDRLVPGGRLMLHVLNREYIINRLPARSWWQGQGCLVLDEAQMFAPTSRLHVHRTVVFETGSQFEHNIGLRVYGLTDLIHMCAQVGLQVLEYSGSRHTRGRIYGATSSEIWLLAQRPMG